MEIVVEELEEISPKHPCTPIDYDCPWYMYDPAV